MSKIESAVRLAKEQRETSAPGAAENLSEASVATDTVLERNQRRFPIVLKLEPHENFDLDEDVLIKNRVIWDGYSEAALTSYKMLRTRVMQKMTTNNWRVLAVTSPRDDAGKTLTAINLAIAMASHGAHDVFLLDLDLKKPDVGERLGLPSFDLDLGEYLAGRLPITRVCCTVGIDRLQVLPSSQRHKNSSELITSEVMQGLLKTISASSANPLVIIDLPAVLAADDALAISTLVDGFLLVVAESQTSRDDVTRSLEMLSESNILGIALNKSTRK